MLIVMQFTGRFMLLKICCVCAYRASKASAAAWAAASRRASSASWDCCKPEVMRTASAVSSLRPWMARSCVLTPTLSFPDQLYEAVIGFRVQHSQNRSKARRGPGEAVEKLLAAGFYPRMDIKEQPDFAVCRPAAVGELFERRAIGGERNMRSQRGELGRVIHDGDAGLEILQGGAVAGRHRLILPLSRRRAAGDKRRHRDSTESAPE